MIYLYSIYRNQKKNAFCSFFIKMSFCLIVVLFNQQKKSKYNLNETELPLLCLCGIPTHYEIILIASTRVLARLRARFASIVCLFPSAFLKLASAISRVC